MGSTFLAKLFIRVWLNLITELTEHIYLHAMLFLIEFFDLAGLGGVKGCWLDTGYMLSSGREGAAPLILKMEDKLSGDEVVGTSDIIVFRNRAALCDGGSMVVWVGIHKGGKTSLVAPDGNVNAFMYLDILENFGLPHLGRTYGNKVRLQGQLRLPKYDCCSERIS